MSVSEARLRAWSHFLGAQALAVRAMEERLKAAGQPSMGWYDVLWALDRAGGRLRISELAERLVIERYNMTRLLDRLEADGLVVRAPDEIDRRSSWAVLTAKGAGLRRQMWEHYQAAINDVFACVLTDDEAQSMTVMMKKIITGLKGGDK